MQNRDLAHQIIAAAYTVHNALGPGFLEKVYENLLLIELQHLGLLAEQQVGIPVFYRNLQVGDFVADLLVEGQIILELKAIEAIHPKHELQLVNYLTATGNDIGLLINFGNRVDVKRKYRTYAP